MTVALVVPGWIPAVVPGPVVDDLLRAGEIPDLRHARQCRAGILRTEAVDMDEESVDRQSVDRHSVDRQSVDRQSVDRQSVDRQSVDEESAMRATVPPACRPQIRPVG